MDNFVKILAILFCLIGSSRGARILIENAPKHHPHLKTDIFCHEADLKLCNGIRTRGDAVREKFPESEDFVDKRVVMGGARLSGRRLSKSKHSSPVGHMQVNNVEKQRVLKSTPSPGVGH